MSERPSYIDAMSELQALLSDAKAPKEVLDSVSRLFQRETELVLLVPNRAPASATRPQSVSRGSDKCESLLRRRAITVKRRLGVAVGLVAALKDQRACRLERDALVEVRRHWPIGTIPGILAIDNFRHALQRRQHLFARANAMMQPIGNMLT